ncbi:MAG: ATP-binding cassette domain-containing protein [Actinomycetota bacterium]|nr:ATP-binding cassette domain-containing protein [Actinomycetota bacterium]
MDPLFDLDAVTVTRGAGDTHTHPLQSVTAQIGAGGCTALVGPSGAGKSTLLRLLNRLEEPDAGQVHFRGRPLPSYDVLDLRRRIGLVQQVAVVLGDTVLDDLRVGRPDLDRPGAAALLDRVGLGPDFLDRQTGSLSGGEAQRVCLGRALAVGPEVLLLDEPTSALDSFAAAAVERVVRGLVADGLTAVLVSHDLRQARRLAQHVLVLDAGVLIAAGPTEELFTGAGDERARRFLAGAP